MLLDVDRGEDVVLHQLLGQDDGVLVVVALPRHECHEKVATERHLTVVGARTVGDDLTGLDPVTLEHDRLLVDAGARVRTTELVQQIGATVTIVLGHGDVVRGHVLDDTADLGHHDIAGVDRGAVLHTRTDQRRLGLDQRHRLALHVAPIRARLRVVVLEERDHRGRDRHHLARRDVHVVDALRRHIVDLATLAAHQNAVVAEPAVGLERLVRLGDDVPVLLVRGEVVDLVADLAAGDLAVRRLDEAERVDPRERRERTDQTDVRAFRSLDRAHPAIVGRVHVTNLEAGPLHETDHPGPEPTGAGGGSGPRAGWSGP